MSPGDILNTIQLAIATGQVMTCTYRHNDGRISTHQIVPYSVEPGARSKTKKVMFWAYCLDHGRIEQRNPEGVLSLETAFGDFDTSGVPPWPMNV